jgi:uncharacterized protein YbjT (DUF2867 family)
VIGVVGATGSVGSALVDALAGAGAPVRAFTRRPAAWTGPAVDVVRLDADGSPDGVFDGVRAAFLMSDQRIVPGGTPTRLVRLVDAAVACGVEHLVLLSVFSGAAGDDPVGRWSAASEAVVTDSGVPWTLLRPGRFFANAGHWARFVRAREPVPLGFARRRAAGVDPADVAAVAARALTDPALPAGMAPRLTGPQALTPLEELAVLGEVLGRSLTAHELTEDDVRRGMLRGGEAPAVVEAMVTRSRDGDDGTDPLPAVADLTGRPPRSFEDWARAHATLFA